MKLIIRTADDVAAALAEQDAEAARAAAKAYLDSTDWLVVRQAENGNPVPPDVLERRARARAAL